MLNANPSCCKLSIVTLTLGMIAVFGLHVRAQEAPAIHVGNEKITGVVDDWTHHHHIFSDPGTADDALQNGTYDKWFRITNDRRYVMQQLKRGLPARGSSGDDVAWFEEARKARREQEPWGWERRKDEQPKLNKDWSMVLGSGATVLGVGAGMFPAKYSFSATATANCSNVVSPTLPDYVVYNTGAAGSTTQATVVAYDNLYSGCSTYGAVPSVYWAFNTGGTVVTSVVLSSTGTELAFVQTPSSGSAQLVILTPSKTPTGPRNSLAGTVSGTGFTVTGGSLTSMDVGAVLAGTNIPAGDTIATVTGTGTTGTLTTGATVSTSEPLTVSADAGSPVTLTASSYPCSTPPCMFTVTFGGSGTHTDTNSAPYYDYNSDTLYVGDSIGYLHKFHPVFSGAPAEASGWPVQVSSNILTSPVYDSTSGDVFVADSGGYLYSYTTGGTLVAKSSRLAVGSKGIVDSPMVDSSAGTVYVTVGEDGNTDGSAACDATTGCQGVFQFVISTFNTTGTGTCALSTDNTTWTSGTNCGAESVMGKGSANPTLYDGSFDNTYFTAAASSRLGSLWTCAANGTPAAKLVVSPIAGFSTSPVYTTATNANTPGSGASTCSPVTEVYNGSTDYIYMGVTNNGAFSPCSGTGGCAYSFEVGSATTSTATGTTTSGSESIGSSGFFQTAWASSKPAIYGTGLTANQNGPSSQSAIQTVPNTSSATVNQNASATTSSDVFTVVIAAPATSTDGLAATGGTSGIVIDNTLSSPAGTSQIYFSTNGAEACSTSKNINVTNGSCAVQASQSALQ